MKNYKILLFTFLMLPILVFSQEKEKDTIIKDKPERAAFESSYIIDNPTNVLLSKNALEVQMSHRFGLINGGKNDLAGFWAPSNIRIGLAYGIHERLTIGYGTTKFSRLQDFNWKVGILKQTRSNKIPVSVSYYGNFVVDARQKNQGLFINTDDRYSYFNQLIIARRFNSKLSIQVAPSVSHYNIVKNTMRNDMVAVAVGGRYKISSQTALTVDYSQPITEFLKDNPSPGISIGLEFSTSAHAFQLFITNYQGIVPQNNYMFNQNDGFGKGEFNPFGSGGGQFLIGFNITRIYNF
jgi:hypothetical protein